MPEGGNFSSNFKGKESKGGNFFSKGRGKLFIQFQKSNKKINALFQVNETVTHIDVKQDFLRLLILIFFVEHHANFEMILLKWKLSDGIGL